jgi:hypothetical protein
MPIQCEDWYKLGINLGDRWRKRFRSSLKG